MRLHETDANILLQACFTTPHLRRLSLADNAMYSLRLVLKVENLCLFDQPAKLFLQELDLSGNFFGSGYDDSPAQSSAEDFAELIARFTSLRALDLSNNNINDAEGAAIAGALATHRHLTALDLSNNNMRAHTQHALRTAWAGPAHGLVL